MTFKLLAAIFALVALPLLAQAQQQPPAAKKTTPADVERVAKLIAADKTKTQAYCDLDKLNDEMEQAQQKKDDKKVQEIAKRVEELAKKVGAEYATLLTGLEQIDPNSKEGEQIIAAFQVFDKLCPAK